MTNRIAAAVASLSLVGLYLFYVGYYRLEGYLEVFGLTVGSVDASPRDIATLEVTPLFGALFTFAIAELNFFDFRPPESAMPPSRWEVALWWILGALSSAGPVVILVALLLFDVGDPREQLTMLGLALGFSVAGVLDSLKPWLQGRASPFHAVRMRTPVCIFLPMFVFFIVVGYPSGASRVAQHAAEDHLKPDAQRPMPTVCIAEGDRNTANRVIAARGEIVFVVDDSGRVRAVNLADRDVVYRPAEDTCR